MGLYGGLGHYLFTLAYQYAPASLLAPVIYLQLFWAGLLGWLIFNSTPDALSVLGMAIIACAGLMVAVKSRRSRN
jgi:drug/metabolite transporter (DMT)-like permease